jgi:hypothetical protein
MLKLQSETYSIYKSKNNLKTMVDNGITPMGALSYLSDCCGSVSNTDY